MPLDSDAIVQIAETKHALGISDADLLTDGIRIWSDGVSGETAATAQVSAADVLTLTITGGANAGTVTRDLTAAAYDTLTELVTDINSNVTGWNAELIAPAAASSADLYAEAAISVSGVSSAGVLRIVNNELIAQWINRATDRIESKLRYPVISAARSEYYTPTGDGRIVLRGAPVTAVTRVGFRGIGVMRIRNTSSDAQHATVRVRNFEGSNQMVLTVVGGANAGANTLDLTAAANDTVSELVGVIAALGSGWDAEVINSDYNSFVTTSLLDIPAWDVLDQWLNMDVVDYYDGEYYVNEDAGVLTFADGAAAFGFRHGPRVDSVLVEYTSGWAAAAVPEEIREAAVELVRSRKTNNESNPAFSSERLGDYQYQKIPTFGKSTAALENNMLQNLIGYYIRYVPVSEM